MKDTIIFACATIDEQSRRLIAVAGGRSRRLFSGKIMEDDPHNVLLIEMPQGTDISVQHGSGHSDEWQLNFLLPNGTTQIGLVFETNTDVRRTRLRFVEAVEIGDVNR